MNRIELDHWYIDGDELSINLIGFFVKIKILKNNKFVYYQLYIKGDKTLTFNFDTIEDAITFTEQIVNKCHDTDEVVEKYISMFENGKFVIKTYRKKKS